MEIEDIKKVLILGGGTMGQQTALICAIHGYDVVMYDISMDILEKGLARVKKNSIRLTASGLCTKKMAEAAIDRIALTDKPETAADNIDFIIESVPEDPELKGRIFAMFHKLCKPEAIFTTNTSTLIPSMIAHAVGRPDKFCAFHFHDISMTKIVDIMPHPGTSAETIEIVKAFAGRINQVPIMLHMENNGYVFNTMLIAFIESALTLATKKVASIEDIDRSWMGILNTKLGPFGIIDSIGLDTLCKIIEYWAQKRQDPKALANAALLKTYIEQGNLGIKTRKGFYNYPDPTYSKRDFLEPAN